jgi:hypothetical protein
MVWRFWKHPATWAALWMALAGAGCRQSRQQESHDAVPGLKLETVEFRVYRGSELRASGRTARVEYRRDADELLARNLAATLPDRGGEVLLTATEGQGRLRAGTFEARRGLTLARRDVIARTDAARYEPGPPAMIRGESPVTVDGTGWRLTGAGFTVDPRTGDLAVLGGAHLEASLAGAR